MARYMGSPGFVSPGAMAGNAIEQFFLQRDAQQRQQLLDQFAMKQQQEQSARAAAELQLRQQQEARIAQERQAAAAAQVEQQKATLMDRADARAMTFMNADANRMAQAERATADREGANQRAQESNQLRETLANIAASGRSETTDLRNQVLQGQIDAQKQKQEDADNIKARSLESMKNYGDQALAVIGRLLDEQGNLTPNAAGVVGGFQGRVSPSFFLSEGSQSALSDIDRLQSMLNIDTLMQMKQQSKTGATGFGALSEKELAVIEAAASTLRNRSQGEPAYAAELKRLRDAFRVGRTAAPSASSGPQVGEHRVIDGVPAHWDGQGWLPD